MATSATTRSVSITMGQIGQITDRLTTKLRYSGLPSDAVQKVLAAPGGGAIDEMVAVLRKCVEINSNQIVRIVTVSSNLFGRAALEATRRVLYVNDDVVKAMPRSEQDKTEVVFFNVARYFTNAELKIEYELRGLSPVDPFSLAAVNEADPTFADNRPNATHWQDENGKWCYAAFRRWDVKRVVIVRRLGSAWYDFWWFAGVRKSA